MSSPVSNPNPSNRWWSRAVWALLALFIGLTVWWVQPRPAPVEEVLEASMSVPSEWVEQARVTSPDGKLDAVIVHANTTEALLRQATEGHPIQRTPIENQQHQPYNRVLCVRLVPKGARIERERPYPFPTGLFLEWVKDKSVFVGFYAPNLTVSWKDDKTLLVQGDVPKVVHQARETERPRRVLVEYDITVPNS